MATLVRYDKTEANRWTGKHEVMVGFSQRKNSTSEHPTVTCRVSFAQGQEVQAEQFAKQVRDLIDERIPASSCYWDDKHYLPSNWLSRVLGYLSRQLRQWEVKSKIAMR